MKMLHVHSSCLILIYRSVDYFGFICVQKVRVWLYPRHRASRNGEKLMTVVQRVSKRVAKWINNAARYQQSVSAWASSVQYVIHPLSLLKTIKYVRSDYANTPFTSSIQGYCHFEAQQRESPHAWQATPCLPLYLHPIHRFASHLRDAFRGALRTAP